MKRSWAVLFLAAAACSALWSQAPERGVPGKFDYYVMSLSWSPEHCSGPNGARDRVQCAGPKKYGFIVHGLWPQYERGWPEACSTQQGPDRQTIDAVLPVMPSQALIRHEWSKHGTCTGMTAPQYFSLIRKTFASIKIPTEYQEPLKQLTVKPADIERKFIAANPGMSEQSVAVQCAGGRFLREVRLCLDKNLKPRPCSSEVRECRSQQIIMQPVR